MASSDLSKSTGQLGVTPTTYICPKLAGSVASGVVFLGVLVLMLIPRPDHGSPVIDEASLNNSPEPEVALTTSSPRINLPNSATPSTPAILPSAEPKPNIAPPAEQDPVVPAPTSPEATPQEGSPTPEADPAPPEPQGPIERENVIKVLNGEYQRILRGDEFVMRGTEEGTVNIKLAAVSAPNTGLGRNRSTGALREMLRGPVVVQCIENVEKKDWTGWVFANGVEVNEAMIAEGVAWYDPRTVKSVALRDLQEQARAAGLGLWKGGNVEPLFPDELQAIGTEEVTPETTEEAAVEDTNVEDLNDEVDSTSADATEAQLEASAAEVPTISEESSPSEEVTKPVVVDQSSPEKLITSFKAALRQNDLGAARGLLSSRPYGRARSFYEDRLSESAIKGLRIAFDGATIQAMHPISRKLNVVMETSKGKSMQVVVEQVDSDWKIVTWDVPR